jgi:hypothetical protein
MIPFLGHNVSKTSGRPSPLFPSIGPSICGMAWICELVGVSTVLIRYHWSRFKAVETPASSQIVVVAREFRDELCIDKRRILDWSEEADRRRRERLNNVVALLDERRLRSQTAERAEMFTARTIPMTKKRRRTHAYDMIESFTDDLDLRPIGGQRDLREHIGDPGPGEPIRGCPALCGRATPKYW